MALSDLLPPDGVVTNLSASSRKQVIQSLAELAVRFCDANTRDIVDAVLERERLGSTGVGDGVAIPHARVEGVGRVFGVFARLKTPVDFDAIDGRPTDLIVMLLAPEDSSAEPLKALARISRLFRREDMRERLRGAADSDALNAILGGEVASDAA